MLISLSMLVGLWLSFCLRQDLSKPAGSAKTPKQPLHFEQAPWHFPSCAASRTSTVDLQLDTCSKSSLRLCQGEGAKQISPCSLRQGDVSCVASLDGENAWKALPDSAGKTYLLLPFLLFPLLLSPPHLFSSSIFTSTVLVRKQCKNSSGSCSEGYSAWLGLKQLCIFGHMLNTHNVSCFLVFKAKFFYHCLRT